MRTSSIPAPRRPVGALVAVAAGPCPDLRREDPREHRRRPLIVHVPAPLAVSGALSEVAEAYGQRTHRRVVDVYL